MAGCSAGGYCALQAGWLWQSLRPRAVVSLYGMSLATASWYDTPRPEARPLSHRLPEKVDEAGAAALLSAKGPPLTAFPTNDWSHPRAALYRYLINHGLYWRTASGLPSHAELPPSQFLLPALNVGPSYPPTLLLHGVADSTVLVDDSDAVHRALTAAAVECVYLRVEGAEHGCDNRTVPDVSAEKARVISFMVAHAGQQ